MSRSDGQGSTVGAHLRESARRKGQALDEPELPDSLAYLWTWYNEVARSRPPSMTGIAAVGAREIVAWAQLRRQEVAPHETDALYAIDATYIAALTDGESDEEKTIEHPATPTRAWPTR